MQHLHMRTVHNVYLLTVVGPLHKETARSLKKMLAPILRKEKHPTLLVDLNEVESINGLGLGALIFCLKKTLQKNGQMILIGLNPRPKLFLELTRAAQVFLLIEDLETALDNFAVCPKV